MKDEQHMEVNMNNTQDYTQATLDSWDEAAPLHAKINSDLFHTVSEPDYCNFTPYFLQALKDVNFKDKACVQICCNNGQDLISLKKMGAGYSLGIDGAQGFIEQAIQLAKAAEVTDIHFVKHNIYQLPQEYENTFDLAIITVGVLNWMPDLSAFFKICASLLKTGGQLIIEDIHPVLNMYEEGSPSFLNASYFEKQPYVDTKGLDYFTGKPYAAKPNYWFQHTMSDIFMAAIQQNLQLQHMDEIAQNVGNFCADLEHTAHNPPLAFVASWKKTA